MRKRLYLDRFEGDFAVVIPEDSEDERNVPRADVPPDASEGVWLVHDGKAYRVDNAATQKAKERVQSLMDELSG